MTPKNREELVDVVVLELGGPRWLENQPFYIARAEALLTALEDHGCAVVPVEATEEMVDAAWSTNATFDFDGGACNALDEFTAPYDAAIAASPFRKVTP